MNLKTQARHFLTFLAGLGTLFLGWNIIAPEQVAEVNKAGGDLIEPLLIIIGAVGVCLSRVAIGWAGRWFTRLMERAADKSSGGVSGGALLLILSMTAVAVGFALPSCSTFSGSLTYRDANTGVEGGLAFKPGQKPSGRLTAPILDAETGEEIGRVDLRSGK